MECINEANVFGSSFMNSVLIIIYGMGTSSLNETVVEHALLPTDGAVIYECQSGVLSIIGTVKARTCCRFKGRRRKLLYMVT